MPFPAGSAADTVARLIGSKLSDKLGQPFIVDNRDGASGAIGTAKLANSDPDGYTIGLATTTTLVTVPVLNKGVGYNPLTDFAPVAMIGYSPFMLVVYPAVPAATVAEYIALAKAKPGSLSYSSEGEASLARLGAELFAKTANIKLNRIPYKSSTQAVIDLLAGRIDSQFGILTTTKRYINNGQLRALGVTTRAAHCGSSGCADDRQIRPARFRSSLWMAIIAPAKLPSNIVDHAEPRHQSDTGAGRRSSEISPIRPFSSIRTRPWNFTHSIRKRYQEMDGSRRQSGTRPVDLLPH